MNILILLFASSREAVGSSKLSLTIDRDEITLLDLADHLQSSYPQLRIVVRGADGVTSLVDTINFAINKKYSRDPTVLIRNGDEIAVIPPISGG
jgi:molybdopterin converting factor small subunit